MLDCRDARQFRRITVQAIHKTVHIAVLFLLCFDSAAKPGEADPLFLGDELIAAKIVAPFTSIMRDRDSEEETPASFQFIDNSGAIVEFDVGIKTRGHFRRNKEICTFAPLRLNFKKSVTKDTEFDHQDKLKLVTHCRKYPKRYQQTIVAEYLAYRMFNILTDKSFRARLAQVTYIDTDDASSEFESLAILIEDEDRLAARTGQPVVDVELADLAELRPDFTNLTAVFHYFIGNTDFSPKSSSPDTRCCHNHRLFAREGELYYSVPYDFDQSGLVNAPHAAPNPRFELGSVKERLYRGRCEFIPYLPESLALFRDKRAEIELLVEQQVELAERDKKNMLRYIEDFYATINNPKMVEWEFVRKCT